MILLLQPPFFGLEKGKGTPSLPLALVYAAALLPHDEPVRVIDLRLERLADDRVRRWPDEGVRCIGLTAMTGLQAKAAARVARRLRELGAGPLVWGGKHATLFGPDLVRQGLADFAVRGDGEQTFASLAAALRDGRPPADIPGLCFRQGDDVAVTALFLDDGTRQAFLLNYDLICLQAFTIERFRKSISQATGVPAGRPT